MQNQRSQELYATACRYFPGGVNSPVRAFKNVNSTPFVVAKGEGSKITDVDGNEMIDYVMSWGPLVLGHRHPDVEKAVIESLSRGWSYGAPCEAENQLAEKVQHLVPSMKKMRFVSSGTEAVMGALRLARGATGRDLIIKCDGGYHGHSDGLLVSAGSGLATLGTSSSSGVPQSFAEKTIVIPINDIDALQEALEKYGDQVAAFILEPVNGNVGCILPKAGYLKAARELTQKSGTLLIFDEVMCGFRASLGGAQSHYGVTPDITVLGKVIGGGFPVGAYGASAELMGHIAPDGPVYQAGTLSGNPVAMQAGLATLTALENGAHDVACQRVEQLRIGIEKLQNKWALPTCFQSVGSMFSLFLTSGPVENYADAGRANADTFAKFHRAMLEHGIFMAPSPFEAGFMSAAHSEDDIQHTLSALETILPQLA
jgi:glutamate-1-semialdehyde 2,1-aminomutase